MHRIKLIELKAASETIQMKSGNDNSKEDSTHIENTKK